MVGVSISLGSVLWLRLGLVLGHANLGVVLFNSPATSATF